ncbi:c-type cytochrome [Fulvivirga sedimenti]|uniref:Cytochrome c n=1 Tax=Fulvivirga sedimenti TaxID=2879465 RepID=A0A9X1HTL5_9BACT|nr:cytochrome c [Fulvivirga sedimenti]MCA6078043.1 cytochrome c [Fulvivirga sedimenti]
MKNFLFVLLTAWALTSCNSSSTSGSEMSQEDNMKKAQYMVAGETLFLQYCSNCHQQDGTGLADLYPPLKDSDYLANNYEAIICIIKNGKQGEIVVNGKTYNQIMPPLNMLTDLEVAEIGTYVFNTFSENKRFVPVTEVTRILAECGEGN